MRVITYILFSCLALSLTAQPLDTTVTDCNGMNKSIRSVLGTGKALIIAHEGVDCSICQSTAANLQSLANQNKTKVEVWAAMTWRYQPSTFNPPCTATVNWVNQYNWTDIFTFPDLNRDWVASGSPRYYVYSPRDSMIVWQGSSQSVAFNTAIQQSTVGIPESRPEPIKAYGYAGSIYLQNIPTNVDKVRIMDIQGRVVRELTQINQGSLEIKDLKNGIWMVQLSEDGEYRQARKIALFQ